MQAERWKQIEDLCQAALDQPPEKRAAFLAQACPDDPQLRGEVESLLDQQADSFLEGVPISAIKGLSAGTKLGNFEIVGLLGRGGMGEVYRARDTRLNREVAIKVSTERFTDRFEREAHIIAALNHPNICTLHDVGPNYLVMELVEGTALADRIKEGPIPLDEALGIARQIADALEAAHEKGIVHRDLKPSNIKVKPDGSVKVLDFGLAKVSGSTVQGGDPEKSPTVTVEQATVAGVILGTAAYMSPEQARGKPVDKRADIWAFGVVLYEMLTGRPMFRGETVTDVLAAVVKEEPALSRVPAKARRLVAACLEKDPERRLRDIGDSWYLAEEAATPAARTTAQKVLPWLITGLVTVTLLVIALMRGPTEVATRRLMLSVMLPENGTLYWNAPPAVSPDGRLIAFGAVVDGVGGIWVRDLVSGAVRSLPETEGATALAWSPNGRSIAFQATDRSLKRVDHAGGTARTICALLNGFGGVSWGANDTIIFTDPKGTWRVPAGGGTPTLVAALDAATEVWHTNPWFLPDGRHFLVVVTGKKAEDSAIYAADIDSKDTARNWRRVLATARASFAYAQGHLLYLRDRTLMAQPFDLGRLATTGEAVRVAEAVDNFQGWTRWGVSQNGVLAYTSGAIGLEQLTWYDRAGKRLASIGPPGLINTLAISPDGSTVAFDIFDESAGSNIWLHDLTRGSDSRFTAGYYGRPVWSPDGSSIAYSSRGFAQAEAYQKLRIGGQAQKVGDGWIGDWSSDGRYMMAETLAPKTRGLWVIPLFGDHKATAYLQTEFDAREGKFSPDMRWVAYASNETGRFEIYVQGFPTPSEKFQISTSGGDFPVWSRDGKQLYFVSADSRMMAAEMITAGGRLLAGVPKALFATRLAEIADLHNGTPFDVSKDGRFLLVTPQWAPGRPITVVINWNAGLKR